MADKRRTKPPHQPTKAARDTVSMHTLVGTAQADVARISEQRKIEGGG